MLIFKKIYNRLKLICKKIIAIFGLIKDINFVRIKKGFKYIKKNGFKSLYKKILKHYGQKKIQANISNDYKLWIKNNEPNTDELEKQKKKKFKFSPKISIVVPMYNTPEIFFIDMVNSLKNQTYNNFELCLADGSKDKAEYIDNVIKDDDRIKYKLLERNGGISYNSNEALKMATGEYIILLDHDDILPEFCLYEIVKCINENIDVDLIYTDEDIIIEGKGRINPHFKPDFSPDTLRSYNYICHLVAFKKSIIEKVGYFDPNMDGSQDYDLVLRITENTNNIVHIPKILYHWRSHINSTSGNSDSKNYVLDAGKRALENHLQRLNLKGKVNILDTYGRYQIDYDIVNNPKVSILIPNKDNISDLKKCLDSIITKSTYTNYEIIIIENNSEDKKTFDYYNEIEKKYSNIKVIKYTESGFNYSRINNFGAKYADGEYLLLLNNDTSIITLDWIEKMLGICQRNDVGIVGAKLLYKDNTVQHAGVVIGIGGIARTY